MQLEQIFAHLRAWWIRVGQDIQTGPLYLFGSTVYKGGDQFNKVVSDLDLVTIIPPSLPSAIERTRWLENLLGHKLKLEQEMLVLLKRQDASEPIVSLVPITDLELEADVHKSKVRDFFRGNTFLLLGQEEVFSKPMAGLHRAGTLNLSNDMVRQVLEYSQSIRNKFLGMSAIAECSLLTWSSNVEPAPKELMRHAALVASSELPVENAQERFDVNVGLGQLNSYIFLRRLENDLYREAYDWLTLRIGGRGDKDKAKELSPSLHLFFGEIMYDLAAASVTRSPTQPNAMRDDSGSLTRSAHQHTDKASSSALSSNSSAESVSLQLATQREDASLIPVKLRISSSGILEGAPEDVSASLEEASLNLKWRRKPYFDLVLAELNQAQATLTATSQKSDSMSRIARAKALDRKLQLEAIRPRLILGLQLLIFYQRIFFISEGSRVEDLSKAISSYTLLCLDPTAEATHFGGPLVAYPIALIDRIRIHKIQFGLPNPVIANELLSGQKDSPKASWTWLAANNQSMKEISQSALATHFIPLLVRAIVNSGELGDDAVEASDEELAWLCHMQSWMVGVH